MKKGRDAALLFETSAEVSVQVFANQTGQLKHGDLRFAKHGLELVISIDVAFVDFVLQIVFLDVDPHFADHLSARHRA